MITIASEQIQRFAPSLGDDVASSIADSANTATSAYGLDSTALRVQHFMAQCAAETGGFLTWSEVLNYPYADRLPVVWPTRFYLRGPDRTGKIVNLGHGPLNAVDYAKNPEKLANAVYCNRNGNGDEASGDGFAFRGRGAIDLTFRDNYAAFSTAINGDDSLVQNPDLLADYGYGFMSAGWYWQTNHIAPLADKDDFSAITNVVNRPGAADLPRVVAERQRWINLAKTVFA